MPDNKGDVIIEDCQSTGEPYFVFRAKDFFSTQVLTHYEDLINRYGPEDTKFHREIIDKLHEFKHWQRDNTDKVRYPD